MCQFCVEHGEGKRWYLQAQNYAFDLDSDLKRREYVVNFVRGFDAMRSTAITAGETLRKVPAPLSRLGKHSISKHQQKTHFGQPVPLEDCEQILDLATSITVIPCICRMHERGKSADEVCILVTAKPITDVLDEAFASYEDGPDLDDFHAMTKDETMALLRSCEEGGLMHSIWTFHTPFTAAICNCNLASGCMAMKLTAGYDIKIMWRGETVAQLDAEACTGCRACAKLCPFDAIDASKSGPVTMLAEKCWGCGICRAGCRKDAISLVDRRTVPAVAHLW
jgi:Pyruvate/2-oxoacid:ferredoxin oxidoreductase delta subunit